MTDLYAVPASDAWSLLPELVLAGGGVLLTLLEAFVPALRRTFTPVTLIAIVAAGAATTAVPLGASFGGLIEASPLTVATSLVVLLAGALAVLASEGYLRREGILAGEYHALLLWCAVGVLLMARATDLLTVFLGLELLSICLYSLAAYHRRLAMATEAGIKYFLMGAFVSAFVLLGLAILYGETGATRLDAVAEAIAAGRGSPPLLTLAVLLLVAGFGFKMSLVPFHAWAPDVYQGAPSPFVAFLSVAPKAASAVVLLRVLTAASEGDWGRGWGDLMALLAVLSMVGGNLLALVQRDIKRMLAYSGIAHMGYLLIPLAGPAAVAAPPVLVYLVAYALMNAGAFALVAILYPRPGEQHLIGDLAGQGYRHPLLGACLTVCMLSLGGIPPTAGFVAKYVVFLHAVRHDALWLALVGVAASLVGVFYYLRVVYNLYMREELRPPESLRGDAWGRAAALGAAAGTLALGVWPGPLLEWVATALR